MSFEKSSYAYINMIIFMSRSPQKIYITLHFTARQEHMKTIIYRKKIILCSEYFYPLVLRIARETAIFFSPDLNFGFINNIEK